MLFQTSSPTTHAPALPLPPIENQRRHKRAPLVLFGTCSLSDATSFPCHTRDLSASGIAVYAPVHAQTGARASIALERLGAFSGEVARTYAGGFAIELDIGIAARETLAEQLAWMSMRSSLGVVEDYRFATARLMPTVYMQVAGKTHAVQLIDASRNGVAIRTFETMAPGACVMIGKTQGRVLHVFPGGAAIEFMAAVTRLPSGVIDF
jgi:hypothetical protein